MYYYLSGKLYNTTESYLKLCIFLSYKTNFPSLSNNSSINSDIGWGCTIRSAQMLLANTILCHLLQTQDKIIAPEKIEHIKFKILQDFNDNKNCVFSLHTFVKYYPQIEKNICEWCGPCSICKLLEYISPNIVKKYNMVLLHNYDKSKIELYKFTNSCFMVLFSMRIALRSINADSEKELFKIMRFPQFIGIIGGSGQSSYFFTGYSKNMQGKEELLYLDPHICQQYNKKLEISQYVTQNIKSISVQKISPSLAIGFYCQNYMELEQLYQMLQDNKIIDVQFHKEMKSEIEDEWEIFS